MLTRGTRRNGDIVLLIDPHTDTRMMYAEYLQYQGVHTMTVPTAGEALALASKVDLIVTALLLPAYMDGIRFIERLKGDPATRRIPLIVVTACAWASARGRAHQAGCDLFLTKPCLPDALAREVRRFLPTSTSAVRPIPCGARFGTAAM